MNQLLNQESLSREEIKLCSDWSKKLLISVGSRYFCLRFPLGTEQLRFFFIKDVVYLTVSVNLLSNSVTNCYVSHRFMLRKRTLIYLTWWAEDEL